MVEAVQIVMVGIVALIVIVFHLSRRPEARAIRKALPPGTLTFLRWWIRVRLIIAVLMILIAIIVMVIIVSLRT